LFEKIGVALLSWLLPGAGYGLKRDWLLFAINFGLIQGVFLVGMLCLQGAVVVPELNRASPEFALINVLVFAAQLMNGLLGLVSLVGTSSNPGFLGNSLTSWQSDLGTFYLLISGALNIFVVLGIMDRYYCWAPVKQEDLAMLPGMSKLADPKSILDEAPVASTAKPEPSRKNRP